MDMELLNSLIIRSEISHMKVRVICCNIGNTQLLSHLKVYKTHNIFFKNPFDENRKVYSIVCDTPRCSKNMRNHTLDYGMIIKLEGENIDI